jgi:hypothetical protein
MLITPPIPPFDVLGRRILVNIDAGDHSRYRALDVEFTRARSEIGAAIDV